MIRKSPFYLIAFCIALFFPLFSYDSTASEILTWKDCVQEALDNHPDLFSARARIAQREADKIIARSIMLPQIEGDARYERSDASNRNESDLYSYGLTGRQLLFDGFKTSFEVKAASEQIRSAQYNYDLVSSEVRERLRTAFIELLRSQELLKITEDIVQRRKQNAELVKLRYEAGREHRGSLLTAEANLAQAQFETSQAKRSIDLVQKKLTKELGRKEFLPIHVVGDLTVPTVIREERSFLELAEDHPSVKNLSAATEAARFGVKALKRDFFPKIYADGHIGRTDSDWPPGEDEWSAGVSLSFPLFEGGSRFAGVSRAESELNQRESDERSGRDGVLLQLEQAWTEYEDAVDGVRVQEKFLEAARERSRIARAQYGTGLISFDNWTIIEDELVRTEKSFLEARTNALLAEAFWVKAKGGTLEHE